VVGLPRVPDRRQGCIIGRGCWAGLGLVVNSCKQCQKWWSGTALTVGRQLGAGDFIFRG